MDTLKAGLAPFASREFIRHHRGQTNQVLQQILGEPAKDLKKPFHHLDAAALLRVMWASWNEVYRDVLGQAERSLVSELRDVRNRWAHQEAFSSDDAYRALDSTHRLLTAVSSPASGEVETMKMELLRVRFDEQARTQRRRTAGTAIENQATGGLAPWREVVSPHQDVASGRYQQAEFAADLWQVHLGEGSPEYLDPSEFFRRTYLTDSLKQLLGGAVQRLSGRRRPRGTASDKLRRRQDPLDAGTLPSLLRHDCQRIVWYGCDYAGNRGSGAPFGEPGGPGRQPDIAGQSQHQGRPPRSADIMGRDRLATRADGRGPG